MSKINENAINMIILGEVSSGKSTLLNSMHIKTFSDMKRIRTTMSANIYSETTDKSKIQSIDDILKSNQKYEKDMKGNKLDDIKENIYFVSPSTNFGSLLSNLGYNLNIIDFPGLNDGVGNDAIMKWIDNNFNKLDIIVHVIGNAFNTESERNILKMICDKMKLNNNTKLITVINKHDDDEDEELKEMKEQAELYIENTLKEYSIDKDRYRTCAISAERGYLYRYVKYNKKLEGLTQKHKMLIAEMELGRKAKNHDDDQLLGELLESINKSDIPLNEFTRYNKFIDIFKELIVDDIATIYYKKMVNNLKFTTLDDFLYKYNEIIKKAEISEVNEDTYFINNINKFIDYLFAIGFKETKDFTNLIESFNNYSYLFDIHKNYKQIVDNIFIKFNNITTINSLYCATSFVNKCDIIDDEYCKKYIDIFVLNNNMIKIIILNTTYNDNDDFICKNYKYIFGDIIVSLISIIKKIKGLSSNKKTISIIFNNYIDLIFNLYKSFDGDNKENILSLTILFIKAVSHNIPEFAQKYHSIVLFDSININQNIFSIFSHHIQTGKENILDIISPMFMQLYKLTNYIEQQEEGPIDVVILQ
jgi:GTPase Era involved in 16S rRNA processing